jgi:dGTPase
MLDKIIGIIESSLKEMTPNSITKTSLYKLITLGTSGEHVFTRYEKQDPLNDESKLLVKLKEEIHIGKDSISNKEKMWNKILNDFISYFIQDVTINSLKCLKKEISNENGEIKHFCIRRTPNNKKNWDKRIYFREKFITYSKTAAKFDKRIQDLIKNRVINSYNVNRFDAKSSYIINRLFEAYYENPRQMKPNYLNLLNIRIKNNCELYYDLEFFDGIKIKEIHFNDDLNTKIDLDNIQRLIQLLKFYNIKELKVPEEFNLNEGLINEINLLDNKMINELDERIKEEYLLIKCLIENQYAYLSTICDYISGMTDNYAKSEYRNLYLI